MADPSDALAAPFYAAHPLALAPIGYWVHLDAVERGSDRSPAWALGCVLVPPLVVGYLLYRSEIGGRTEPAGVTERLVGTAVIVHLVAVQVRFVLSAFDALPFGDPGVGWPTYLLLLAAGGPVGYWLVWRRGWARLRRAFGWVHESETPAPPE